MLVIFFFSEVQKVSSQIQKLFRTVWHMSKAGQFSLNYVNILRIMWKLFFMLIQQYYRVFLLSNSYSVLAGGIWQSAFKLFEFSKISSLEYEDIQNCFCHAQCVKEKGARSNDRMNVKFALFPILFLLKNFSLSSNFMEGQSQEEDQHNGFPLPS